MHFNAIKGSGIKVYMSHLNKENKVVLDKWLIS